MEEVIFRLLPFGIYHPSMAMAIDHAVTESVATGESPPTIRTYQWNPKYSPVSIGRSVLAKTILKRGIRAVRRNTGGWAVAHKGDLTYSFITKKGQVYANGKTLSTPRTMKTVAGFIINGFADLGIDTKLIKPYDIVITTPPVRKICGNAQWDYKGKATLTHGSLFYNNGLDTWLKVLKADPEELKGTLATVTEFLKIDLPTFNSAMVTAFTENPFVNGNYIIEGLTDTELKRATQLAKTKYRYDSDWNRFVNGKGKKGIACAADITTYQTT